MTSYWPTSGGGPYLHPTTGSQFATNLVVQQAAARAFQAHLRRIRESGTPASSPAADPSPPADPDPASYSSVEADMTLIGPALAAALLAVLALAICLALLHAG